MTKITVDKALLEQAIDALPPTFGPVIEPTLRQKLRAALAEPAVEPVAVHQVRLDSGRWLDISADELQNYPAKDLWETRTLYTSPPPAEVPTLAVDDTRKAGTFVMWGGL